MPPQAVEDDLLTMLDAIGQRGFTYAWQMLHHREDALDAVQAALLAVWRGRRRLQRGRDPRGWFYRVLRNKCIDTLRARRAHGPAPLEAAPGVAAPHDPAQDTDHQEALDRLRAALERLPDETREIILLRDYHDLSYAELADVLGIPIGTVMSRLHRARATLRQSLQKEVLP